MKSARLVALFLAGAVALVAAAAQADSSWLTDFKEAQQKAKSEKKLLLVNFTGSDWCGWCIKLNREVFAKPEFKDYANKNLVLLEVDFPRAKPLTTKVQQQNEQLAMQFGVQAFPTLVVLDSDGKKIGALGYDAGVPADSERLEAAPTTFIASVEKLRKG